MQPIGSQQGLSDEKAEELRFQGLCNTPQRPATKSYSHIIFDNIFSVFNLVNALIAAALIYVGSVKNCLFMLAVILNTFVGIVQEIRSKKTIDKLSIVEQPTVSLIRSGKRREALYEELVLGDVIELSVGSQVTNDCEIISGLCEMNESLVTGESEPVIKKEGDTLLSGSFIIGGKALCRIITVGSENYADSVLDRIRYVKKTNSEFVRVINRIITVITALILPLGALLFFNQLSRADSTIKESVESTAAALIGMIPEGLVLLTSAVFVLGIVRLSKKNVLSQDLYSLEALARTDVICIDKTGTITTGEMTVEKAVPANGFRREELEGLIAAYAFATCDDNKTISAVKKAFTQCGSDLGKAISFCPFSSGRKWAAVTFEKLTVIIGSPDIIFGTGLDMTTLGVGDITKYRVLAVAVSNQPIDGFSLPEEVTLAGFILLTEELRSGVKESFEYFKEQGVDIKVISGDSPATVERLCSGVLGSGLKCADLSTMNDEETAAAAENYSVFGRALPEQKRIIISALQKNGHKTAMVGDGVNDVLALKESDCSIAPACAASAARNVSQLVLLDSDFSSLRAVIREGRRSVNNLQNSSSLFLSKTIFSFFMAVVFILVNFEYPFEPIQMTLISTLTIGLPSFFLSLRQNDKPISGSFIGHILRSALPCALTNIIMTVNIVAIANERGLPDAAVSTLCTLALAVTGLILVIYIYRPMSFPTAAVLAVSSVGFTLAFLYFAKFFGFVSVFGSIGGYMGIIAVCDAVIMCILLRIFAFIRNH